MDTIIFTFFFLKCVFNFVCISVIFMFVFNIYIYIYITGAVS